MLQGKTVAILVEDGFEDSELSEPSKALQATNARVVIVGSSIKRTYWGKRGRVTISANADVRKVNHQAFDAVIIPGGYAPDKMCLNKPMVDLVKRLYAEGKIVAAICHGPQLLLSAGIVVKKRMTSCPSIAAGLKDAGALWVDEPVVEDGNLITSRRPADLPQFSRAIISALRRSSEVNY